MAFTINDSYQLRNNSSTFNIEEQEPWNDDSKTSGEKQKNILFESAVQFPTFVCNDADSSISCVVNGDKDTNNGDGDGEQHDELVGELKNKMNDENCDDDDEDDEFDVIDEVDDEDEVEKEENDDNESISPLLNRSSLVIRTPQRSSILNSTSVTIEENINNKNNGRIQVFLRLRPISDETQRCTLYNLDLDSHTLWVENTNNTRKPLNYFKFDHIFDPNSSKQWPVFERATLPLLHDFILGRNSLLFTYGITSSGKSYTMRGTTQSPGVIPHTLALLFECIKPYVPSGTPMVKPIKFDDAFQLNTNELRQEAQYNSQMAQYSSNGIVKRELNSFVEFIHRLTKKRLSSVIAPLKKNFKQALVDHIIEISSEEGNEQQVNKDMLTEDSLVEQFHCGVWISYYEIYNEKIYDLLNPVADSHSTTLSSTSISSDGRQHSTVSSSSTSISRSFGISNNGGRRHSKVSILTDQQTNQNYLHGLRQIYVTNAEEAYAVFLYGQDTLKRHIASTTLNQQSSRSHSAFHITLVRNDVRNNSAIVSNLSFCDCAGVERIVRTNPNAAQLKEAKAINNSIMCLNRCLASIRSAQKQQQQWQNDGGAPSAIKMHLPFRESKLTQAFQPYLSGAGGCSYIIYNLNPVSVLFNESYYSLENCTVAKDIRQKVRAVKRKQARLKQRLDCSLQKLVENDYDISILHDTLNESFRISAGNDGNAVEVAASDELIAKLQEEKLIQEMELKQKTRIEVEQIINEYNEMLSKQNDLNEELRDIYQERIAFVVKSAKDDKKKLIAKLEQADLELFEFRERVARLETELAQEKALAKQVVEEKTNDVKEEYDELMQRLQRIEEQNTALDLLVATKDQELEKKTISIAELRFELERTQTKLKQMEEEKCSVVQELQSTRMELDKTSVAHNNLMDLMKKMKEKEKYSHTIFTRLSTLLELFNTNTVNNNSINNSCASPDNTKSPSSDSTKVDENVDKLFDKLRDNIIKVLAASSTVSDVVIVNTNETQISSPRSPQPSSTIVATDDDQSMMIDGKKMTISDQSTMAKQKFCITENSEEEDFVEEDNPNDGDYLPSSQRSLNTTKSCGRKRRIVGAKGKSVAITKPANKATRKSTKNKKVSAKQGASKKQLLSVTRESVENDDPSECSTISQSLNCGKNERYQALELLKSARKMESDSALLSYENKDMRPFSTKKTKLLMSAQKLLDPSPILSPMEAQANIQASGITTTPNGLDLENTDNGGGGFVQRRYNTRNRGATNYRRKLFDN